MPTYTYKCSNGHVEEEIRPIVARDDTRICSVCQKEMKRILEPPGGVWAPTSTGGGMKV